MTLNLWGAHGPWPARRRMIRALLRTEAPDVIALQEVVRPLGPGTAQADELAEGLGYKVAYAPACRLDKPFPSELGNAILTRFPIREHRTVPLPNPHADEPRCLLYLLLSARIGVWPVFTTHLDWQPDRSEARAAQLRFIREYIEAELRVLPERLPAHVRVLPPLLAGDLNAVPDAPEIGLLTRAGDGGAAAFIDCFAAAGDPDAPEAGATYSPRNTCTHKKGRVPAAQRIDYLLLGADGAGAHPVLSARLCLTEPEGDVFASDHFGVLADLSLGADAAADDPAR